VPGAGCELSPELADAVGRPSQDTRVEWLQVAAHGDGGVGMAEDPLDIEQVEDVSAIVGAGVMENGCGGPS
jgi:hypothetical protein